MKAKKMTYKEKLLLSVEKDEPLYDSMHELYGVPDSKPGLLFWYVKNYVKGIKNHILSVLAWVAASAFIVSGFNYLFIDKIEPWLTKHNWNYLNNIRENVQEIYPYIFGSDGRADLFEKYGHAYLKGFDEPWQFIYPKYTAYFDNGNGVMNPQELVRTGIFAVFFSFALISLIGIIVGKIRNQGAKNLFIDFVLIPKQVIGYGKRSETKVLDHLLIGTFTAFIIGFIIKNPFAMPLIALYFLIAFTMGAQSGTILNKFALDCAKKLKDGEKRPLFADSALYVWAIGMGFFFYSILGFYVWKRANFAFEGRLIETAFWLALIIAIYIARNGKKSTKLAAHAAVACLFAGSAVAVQSVKAYATLIEVWLDSNGNRIGQKIILDNKPDGKSYKTYRSSWPDGVAGGAGGLNAGNNRIKRPTSLNNNLGKLMHYRNIILDGRSLDELTPNERDIVNRINQLISDEKHGKSSNTSYKEREEKMLDFVNKMLRGDYAGDMNSTTSNWEINKQAYKDMKSNSFEELARGDTWAAKLTRIPLAVGTAGYSELTLLTFGSQYKAYDHVMKEGQSGGQAWWNTVKDASIDLAASELMTRGLGKGAEKLFNSGKLPFTGNVKNFDALNRNYAGDYLNAQGLKAYGKFVKMGAKGTSFINGKVASLAPSTSQLADHAVPLAYQSASNLAVTLGMTGMYSGGEAVGSSLGAGSVRLENAFNQPRTNAEPIISESLMPFAQSQTLYYPYY